MNRGDRPRERDQPREKSMPIYVVVIMYVNASFRENTLVSNSLHDRWPFDVRYSRLVGKFAMYRV